MPAAELEVVMYRGHPEYALAAAHLEIANLYDHGKSLDHVDEAIGEVAEEQLGKRRLPHPQRRRGIADDRAHRHDASCPGLHWRRR